ncbi:hypothetical protein H671_2g6473 [Cricetulus griseus]|uniref:Uncharacterized protein n=1 Tax=Cricetulus griseus TaxID=10029 RepID=A0A061IJQ9_CRIGR|nr:hypothetical protein H671_2g6473 [Cricetulus griseus]
MSCLKSNSLDTRITIPACFLGPFDWNNLSQPFTPSDTFAGNVHSWVELDAFSSPAVYIAPSCKLVKPTETADLNKGELLVYRLGNHHGTESQNSYGTSLSLFSLALPPSLNFKDNIKKYGESGQPCLALDFRRIALSFSPFNFMLAVGLLYIAFIMLRFICISIECRDSSYWCFHDNAMKHKLVYMVDYIDRFSKDEPTLHPRYEAYLFMVDDFSDMFLDSVCQ